MRKIQEHTVSRLLLFWLVTIAYLFTKWITFKGFSGTDDLHYANLASNVLNGTYSPFIKEDIFSGRVGLIYLQAFIYSIGGINVFTTQIASLLTTILCCYLTVFKLGRIQHGGTLLIACALFYFNPVLNQATLGIMPDAYVMLTTIVVMLLWNRNLSTVSQGRFVAINLLIGAIVLTAMFFKESAVIIIPFIICLGIYQKKINGIKAASIVTASFATGVLACGLVYYWFTNDFFFRVHQIQYSDYPNPCNYALLPRKELLIRLTYGVWKEFIVTGFLPVILAALLIVLGLLSGKGFRKSISPNISCFIMLTILGLYLPFSVNGYQPLCHDSRHFIFLYPFAVIIVAQYIHNSFQIKTPARKHLLISCLLLLLIACISTGNKWIWMIYGLLSAFFASVLIIKNGSILKFRYVAFSLVVWLYMPYHLFFQNSNWFKNAGTLSSQVSGNYFYFPDHVNMMTWKFIRRFDTSFHHYNMEPTSFKLFAPYYEKEDSTFHPGWFIMNGAFNERTPGYFQSIKALGDKGYFTAKKMAGDVTAFYITDTTQYRYIRILTTADFNNPNGCCN